jgi:hypothetical protein
MHDREERSHSPLAFGDRFSLQRCLLTVPPTRPSPRDDPAQTDLTWTMEREGTTPQIFEGGLIRKIALKVWKIEEIVRI